MTKSEKEYIKTQIDGQIEAYLCFRKFFEEHPEKERLYNESQIRYGIASSLLYYALKLKVITLNEWKEKIDILLDMNEECED